MDDPSIHVDGLRRTFGTVTALDGVDLRIGGPGIIGVAGPNGSGKTTFIEILLGLLAPTAGSVRVNGVDPLGFDASDRRRLGYMPQHEAVYSDLTVRENVTFFARLYGVENRRRAVEAALDFVDLTDRADARISELSGGMIRRTSLACAIVHDPDVLFLDEPTVGLDPELRATMWDGFRQRRDAGTLALVLTPFEHGVALFVLVELLSALTALGLGILLSLFAENEFQAIQFIPVVISPQVILGGTFLPVERLPWYLEYPARAMPVTYIVDAMKYVVNGQGTVGEFRVAFVVLLAFGPLAIVVAGAVVRRAG